VIDSDSDNDAMFAVAIIVTLTLILLARDVGAMPRTAYTEAYINALLELHKCFSEEQMTVTDSLFNELTNVTTMKLYYAQLLEFMAHRLQRGSPLCQSMVEAADVIYRQMAWDRRARQHARTKDEADPRAQLYYDELDATIAHFMELVTKHTLRAECDATITSQWRNQGPRWRALIVCTKERRKVAVRASVVSNIAAMPA
jgi:hypothetical protein